MLGGGNVVAGPEQVVHLPENGLFRAGGGVDDEVAVVEIEGAGAVDGWP